MPLQNQGALGGHSLSNTNKLEKNDVPPGRDSGSKMNDRKFTLRLMTPKDKRNVIEFLRKFFFIDEPLNVDTGMNLDYLNGRKCQELETYSTDSIPEGNSVLALNAENQVVGVCINGSSSRDSKGESASCENEKFRKVLVLLEEADKRADIFKKYPNLNKLLDVKIISVDTNWRGLGMCKAMIEFTRKIAKQQNFQMIRIACTSYISAVAAQKLNFEKIQVLNYADYIDRESLKPVFNPPAPHTGLQIFIYKLQNV